MTPKTGDIDDVSPFAIATAAFLLTAGAAALGVVLRSRLPEQHLSGDSRDTVRVGIGLLATLTALVLGLVTASAKSSFDNMDGAMRHMAAELITLDRVLARYGPAAAPVRDGLKRSLDARIQSIWGDGASHFAMDARVGTGVEDLASALRALDPADDEQKYLKSRALDLAEGMLESRWTVFANTPSVPLPFVSIVIGWLAVIFASFGLFAPLNSTVVSILGVCAVSVACAVFLVLELDSPFDGWIRVSRAPMDYALAQLGI